MLDYAAPEMAPLPRFVLANRDVFQPLLLAQFARKPSLNALIRTTTAATVIAGGQEENVLPMQAEAVVNFRLLPGADPESPGDLPETVLDHVRRVVNDQRVHCELLPGAAPPSRVSDHRSEGFRLLQATIRRLDPELVVAPGLAVVATDSRYYQELAENIFRFLPVRLTADDLNRIHGVDERLATDNYLELVRFMTLLLENAADGAFDGR